MNALIIGGTSGLGRELATRLAATGAAVTVTGRTQPDDLGKDLQFRALDLNAPELPKKLVALLADLPELDLFVYAAGFYQKGRVTDLTEQQIDEMLNVGGRGLIFGLRALLQKQAQVPEIIVITSTSQWTPRQQEPVYNFVKAGAGHLANAMAEDGRVGKVLVVGPGGMDTPFWDETPGTDRSQLLDPVWVADQVMDARNNQYKYKCLRILRGPARVEEVETR
jgi:NAD(P)-dependent dehydrogenase (short-subunit alcohol dehydrogenase family)